MIIIGKLLTTNFLPLLFQALLEKQPIVKVKQNQNQVKSLGPNRSSGATIQETGKVVCLSVCFIYFFRSPLGGAFSLHFHPKRGREKNVTDSAKRHWESSELFKPVADLGTARYTPIRGSRCRPRRPPPRRRFASQPLTHPSAAVSTRDGDSAKSSN